MAPGPARSVTLREALGPSVEGVPEAVVLLDEACRIADRLDKLDALLQGDADVWCRLVHDLRTEDYELKVDSALSESRQQVTVLRLVLESIRKMTAKADAPVEEVSPLDEIAARREARLAGTGDPAPTARRAQPRRGGGSNRTG